MENYYQILQLQQDASPIQIRQSYHKLIKIVILFLSLNEL